jgi:hypothetical protein
MKTLSFTPRVARNLKVRSKTKNRSNHQVPFKSSSVLLFLEVLIEMSDFTNNRPTHVRMGDNFEDDEKLDNETMADEER